MTTARTETATLGGGCFWCLDATFRELKGVDTVVSGYAGGDSRGADGSNGSSSAGGETPGPTYEEVCSGRTGHAEVVQVTFDPEEITYRDLLEVFFTIHDPTTLNRQGHDVGTQYRSIILYHSPEQKETAESMIKELDAEGVWEDPIVTEVEPLEEFYPAEEYHQDYFAKNPAQPYCSAVVGPKVAKFRRKWAERLKSA